MSSPGCSETTPPFWAKQGASDRGVGEVTGLVWQPGEVPLRGQWVSGVDSGDGK